MEQAELNKKNLSLVDQVKIFAEEQGMTITEFLEKMARGSRIIAKYRETHQSSVQPDTEEGGTGLHY